MKLFVLKTCIHYKINLYTSKFFKVKAIMAANTDNVQDANNQLEINEEGHPIENDDDIEEGELPEEGEIMDDDDEDKTNQAENQGSLMFRKLNLF